MRLLPTGLAGRTILVLLGAVALVHASSVVVYEAGVRSHAVATRAAEIAERVKAARKVLGDVPPDSRSRVATALSTAALRLTWPAALDNRHTTDTNGRILLDDGSELAFAASLDVDIDQHAHAAVLSTTVMVGGILLVSILLVRSIAAPLRRLARAADRIGHTVEPVAVAEEGPGEVRQVAQAFNAMQERLRQLVHDRTQALAAVSHDLRTPITRLRLRVGFIDDLEAQAKFDTDLDDMDAMIEATLTYLKGGDDSELRRPVDLASLVATVVDDLTDAGNRIAWDGPPHAVALLRPIAIKRALANLAQNAVTHGGVSHISLAPLHDGWRVVVVDEGPGIPPEELDRVRQPFQRLDPARNHSSGGVGLGLAIAVQAVEAEGGTLDLRNREGGGLEVDVRLPGTSVAVRPACKEHATDA